MIYGPCCIVLLKHQFHLPPEVNFKCLMFHILVVLPIWCLDMSLIIARLTKAMSEKNSDLPHPLKCLPERIF